VTFRKIPQVVEQVKLEQAQGHEAQEPQTLIVDSKVKLNEWAPQVLFDQFQWEHFDEGFDVE
jgi:hypothetical protein